MKNMKKLLSALTALSFVAVAGVSTVACGPVEQTEARMSDQILKDLGILNEKGENVLEATINNANWDVTQLANIDAGKLLNADATAKSADAKLFLTSILKLEAKDDKFVPADAAKIKLTIKEVKPILEKVATEELKDFVIKSGAVTVQWKNGDSELGSVYTLNLKGDTTKGVVADHLPELTLAQFDTVNSILKEFKVGGETKDLTKGQIEKFLSPEDSVVKGLKGLVDLVKMGGLKLTILEISTEAPQFEAGDTMTVGINFGDLQFAKTYTFTVAE